MNTITITGSIDLHSKQLNFTNVSPLVAGENRTTLLRVEIPVELSEYDFFITIADSKGNSNISPLLNVETEEKEESVKYYINYPILNDAIKASGRLLLQVSANKELEGKTITYKTLINQQLSASSALLADKQTEELPNLIAETQMAIDYARETAGMILLDKENGAFDGKDGTDGIQGEKGDPSTLDKIGINATVIDLSDNEIGTYGTIDSPIEITENAAIVFQGFTPIVGYQKSFILSVKRTADVAVTWQDITAWAYDEIPLLPVGTVQKILVETVDGVNYYGTGGDVF